MMKGSDPMFVLFQIILIALQALPQGLCCVTAGCYQTTKCCVFETKTANKPCNCCKVKAKPAVSQSDKCAPEKRPPSRSCECKCRFQIAITTSPLSLDEVSYDYCVMHRPAAFNSKPSASYALKIGSHRWIGFQILYCVWRC